MIFFQYVFYFNINMIIGYQVLFYVFLIMEYILVILLYEEKLGDKFDFFYIFILSMKYILISKQMR